MKKQYDKLDKQFDLIGSCKNQYPNFRSFRDHCFEQAQKFKNLENCISGDGWCTECGRDKAWNS
ncbi:hypothetical protein A6V39_01680 [Candidatus Mycoplasma haematobovis]|uniref:Uncharacterized protein n=1 Tax=Candidatus Mycoplasma haematobovis TaxID=432608 RepID=A0A1A9QE57_9MOLU|nr:hypothetical protein A6V39_01680 [Candidatus Mycoplasma haematobovis]